MTATTDAKRGADMIETRGRVESLRRNALAVINRAMNHAKSTAVHSAAALIADEDAT